MYALPLSAGDSTPVDEVCLDDNDDVLGAVSADGMPLTRDDVLIECGRDYCSVSLFDV